MKKLLLLLSCLLTAVLFSGCGIQHPDTVSYVLEAEPSRLDPAMTTALVESNVELQQLALEVGLESEDYEQERADAHDLAMIALDRKIDDDESSRYNAIVQRMLRRAYLAEMALISGETAKEREN